MAKYTKSYVWDGINFKVVFKNKNHNSPSFLFSKKVGYLSTLKNLFIALLNQNISIQYKYKYHIISKMQAWHKLCLDAGITIK
jgi:hypothetical protein